jgi:hypothetical protein
VLDLHGLESAGAWDDKKFFEASLIQARVHPGHLNPDRGFATDFPYHDTGCFPLIYQA